jgi:hypothetical protein
VQYNIANNIDHDKLIGSVLNNGGILAGGYVREWVRFGEPQNFGWNDIDVFCLDTKNIHSIEKEGKKLGVKFDFRAAPPFNDYFCNCWMFDGKIKPVEAKDKKYSVNEIEEQTKSHQAKMMRGSFLRIDKIISFRKNNWTIYFTNGVIATDEIIKSLASNISISRTNLNNVELDF